MTECTSSGGTDSAVRLDLTNGFGVADYVTHLRIYAMHRCYSLSILLLHT